MYETLMRREEEINETRYNDVRLNRGVEYPNPYVSQSDFANTYINNYLPAAPFQNDIYASNSSDNINMNVNDYDMYNVAQQANMFAQAPVYQQTYDYHANAYNNVSAQAQTHPTQYYQPQQTYQNMFRPVQNQEQVVVDYKAPVNSSKKVKNKMAVALIAVYFVIIAVCAALILVNVFASSSASTVNAVSSYVPEESAVRYATAQDGSTIEMTTTPKVIDYTYDTSTNWFDRLCDKIGSKLG